MRKIEQHVCGAFVRGERAASGNTTSDGKRLTLHGHVIAERDASGIIRISNAGWPTATTRSRLNAVCRLAGTRASVWQSDGVQYMAAPDAGYGTKDFVMNDNTFYQIN